MEKKYYSKIPREKGDYPFYDLISLYDYRLRTAPDVPLYTFTDYHTGVRTQIMPEEFVAQYQALGTWLAEQRYERKHIAVMGDSSYEWIRTMQAVICSNNVLVALDRNLEIGTLVEMLKASDAELLFCSEKYRDKAEKLSGILGIKVLILEENAGRIEEGKKLQEAGRCGCIREKLDPDALALLVFTSGTMGSSKCVMLSLRNLVTNTFCCWEQMRLHYHIVFILPFHHVYGLNIAHFPYVLDGKTIHINQSIRDLFRDIRAENPEVIVGVPLFVELFYKMVWKDIREKGLEEKVLSMIEENRKNPELAMDEKLEMFRFATGVLGNRIKGLIVGGAPISDKYYYGFRDLGLDVSQGYGITECSPLVAATYLNANRPGSVGKVLQGTEMMIDRPNEHGEGEVCVRSPGVMLGYYKDEEATGEVIRDGWFHTGDIGYIDEDDYVYLSGRIKNLIILANGENVSPEEIELRLIDHPAIQELVVYAKGDRIAAQIYVSPDAQEEDPQEEIRRFIEQYNDSAPSFKQISVVEFRNSPFERTASQKILRNSLQ